MKINCGIIGLPNVGKSTLFRTLTDISVKVANFPFCTIQPNIALVNVPDSRICRLYDVIQSVSCKKKYGTIEFIDVAGLIKGMSQGEGLGNSVFNCLCMTKILLHVVRCFNNEQIIHIYNNVNPDKDINIINSELILFDILRCEKYIFSLKKIKSMDSVIKYKLLVLEKCLINLNHGFLLNKVKFSDFERKILYCFHFLTFKPIIYIANVGVKNDKSDYYLNMLNKVRSNTDNIIVEFNPELLNSVFAERNVLYDDYNVSMVKIQKKIFLEDLFSKIFIALNLGTFFTINNRMVRAWINSLSVTALEAASQVHSDFRKGFIRVQVIKFSDFISYNGEFGAKRAGKIHMEGKDYLIQDGDILKFLFSS